MTENNDYGLPEERLESKLKDKAPLYSRAEAVAEANRCIYCEDAPCVAKCPTSIDIPGFIHKIATDNVRGSARTIFESKVFAAFNAAFAAFLIAYGAANFTSDAAEAFVAMWRDQSALACVSSCDLAVLSIAMYGALAEDMRRRGCYDGAKAAAFCAVPVLGPCVYLSLIHI